LEVETGRQANPFTQLLTRSYRLEDGAAALQGDEEPPLPQFRELEREYLEWFALCVATIPDDLRKAFADQYEGGTFTPRIKAYLESPRAISAMWSENAPPIFPRWQHPFETRFRPAMLTQRQVLTLAEERFERGRASATVALIKHVAQRFGDYARQLNTRQRGAEPFVITDEYGMQDAFHAALRLLFDDVRPEEWTPSYAGGSSRMDFLVAAEEIAVELKYIHAGQTSRNIGSEVAEDILRYQSHERCKALVAVVWDHAHVLANPRGLESDLTQDQGNLMVVLVVAH
jgi:hypothetical protein